MTNLFQVQIAYFLGVEVNEMVFFLQETKDKNLMSILDSKQMEL